MKVKLQGSCGMGKEDVPYTPTKTIIMEPVILKADDSRFSLTLLGGLALVALML